MRDKVVIAVLAILALTLGISAQNSGKNQPLERCHAETIKQMVSEATKLGLKVDSAAVTFTSGKKSDTAFMPIEGLDKINTDNMKKPVVAGLYFHSSNDPAYLNGIFRLQLSNQSVAPKEQPQGPIVRAELISKDGKSVYSTPFTRLTLPAGLARVYPRDCWIGRTHGVCFPAGTTMTQIRVWIYMCSELGCPV